MTHRRRHRRTELYRSRGDRVICGVCGGLAERYDFDTSTSMADPGTGDIRYNNATVSSVTLIAIAANTAGAGAPDISARIITWDDSTNGALRGTLVIRKGGTPATFATFTVITADAISG